ncbi:17973_t:CDS:2 [Funneliformis geosporum]|nr:17973_t:CDS:2 [Funneliformis geosporum]
MPRVNTLSKTSLSNLPSDIPKIKMPFPPKITAEEFIRDRPLSRLHFKPPNSFFIYRTLFVKQLKSENYNDRMIRVSKWASWFWSNEPSVVKEYYKNIEKDIQNLLKEKCRNNNNQSVYPRFIFEYPNKSKKESDDTLRNNASSDIENSRYFSFNVENVPKEVNYGPIISEFSKPGNENGPVTPTHPGENLISFNLEEQKNFYPPFINSLPFYLPNPLYNNNTSLSSVEYYSLISAYLVLIILYVGYAATPVNAIIINDCENVTKVATGIEINVKANEWIPNGPKISVEVVAKENFINYISIWAELINDGTRLGSWSPISGYSYVYGCNGDAKATIKNQSQLDHNQITFEWNPPSSGSKGTVTSPSSASITASPTSTPAIIPTTTNDDNELVITIGSTPLSLTMLPAFLANDKRSIPSDGSILFKVLLQLNDNSDDEIYSFTSNVIQMSHNNASNSTDKGDGKTPVITASVVDDNYPNNPPFSAANSNFLAECFSSSVLIIVLILSTLFCLII